METLNDFLTIDHVIYGDNEIMAQVVEVKRPFSELKQKLIQVEWNSLMIYLSTILVITAKSIIW